MVYYVYLFSFLGCVAYAGCKLRKPDLLTLCIIACGYYSSALLFGEVYDPENRGYVEINDFIYIFYSFLFVMLTVAVYLNDQYFDKDVKNYGGTIPSDFFYFHIPILTILFLTMNIIDSRSFFPDEVGGFSATSFGAFYNIYWVSALIFLAASFRTNNIFLKTVAIFFLLTTLTAGSRAFFTAGCFSILLWFFQTKSEIRLLMSIKRLSIVLFGFLFLLVYKNIYQYLLVLDYEMLLKAGLDFDLIIFRLTKGSESIVLLNFQHAMALYQESKGSFFDLITIKTIPFVSELYIEGFNFDARTLSDLVDESYYQTVNYGMASSIWGLFYYVSGPLGCLMFGFTYVCIIFYLNVRIKKNDLISLHLIPASIFMAFYASRMEIGAMIFPFYMSFFILIGFKLFRMILPRRGVKTHG